MCFFVALIPLLGIIADPLFKLKEKDPFLFANGAGE